jgi:transposase
MQSETPLRPPLPTDESAPKIRHHAALTDSKSEQHLRSRICFDETETLPPRDVLRALNDKQDTMKTTPIPTHAPAFFLGIDVGKTDLFCHLIGGLKAHSERFDNSAEGIRQLLKWLLKAAPPAHSIACLEQTGHYAKPVAKALANLPLAAVHLINPCLVKSFGKRRLRRNKSDSADARLIAQFIQTEHGKLHTWTPQPKENEELTELSRYAESLTADNARLKTKCEAATNPHILRSLKRRIKAQEKELADARARIRQIIKDHADIRMRHELLTGIPGIGEITSHILLGELPEIELFSDARQLAAWAGVTQQHHSSGTSGRTSTPITKVGSSNLRRALYLPAMSARVCNPPLRAFAERLKESGKKPKQVIIAVMRKLLHQIYGILKSGTPYNPEMRGFQVG